MSRPLIVITTGRNIYSLRAYESVFAVCQRLGLEYDVAHADAEILTSPQVQVLLSHKLCKNRIPIKTNLIQEYRALSKHAANRDIRGEVDAMYRRIVPGLQKSNPGFMKASQEASWIFTGHGIFTKPFIDQSDPRLIQYNQMSLLQWPPTTQRVGRGKVASFLMVDRGGVLGESRFALDPDALPRALFEHSDQGGAAVHTRARSVIKYLRDNRRTAHMGVAPKIDFGGARTIFVPLHCAWDAQMIRFSPLFGRNLDFLLHVYDATKHLKDFQIIAKLHPMGKNGLMGKDNRTLGGDDPVWPKFSKHTKVKFTKANIHDIIPNVDAVVTLNSSVGLEALMYDKPIIVLGRAMYAHIPGVTHTVNTLAESTELLGNVLDLPPTDQHYREVAVDFFWNSYFVPVHPVQPFIDRVQTLAEQCMAGVA